MNTNEESEVGTYQLSTTYCGDDEICITIINTKTGKIVSSEAIRLNKNSWEKANYFKR